MTPFRLALAFILAPAVPAIAYCLPGIVFGAPLDSLFSVFISTSVVTYGHAILLGIPTAVVLTRLNRLTLFRVLGAAFLIGALPFAALVTYNEITMAPGLSSEFNFVPRRIDGHLTRAGWVSIIDGVVMCGIFGMIAGVVWWWVSGASAINPLQPTRETRG